MNQEQIDSMQPIMEKYTAKEWHINRVGAGPDGYTLRVKSPRMNYPFAIHKVYTEDDLLIHEAEHVTAQNHMGPINAALEKIAAKVIHDVGVLYLLQSRGKEGVVIPTELILHDVKIPLVYAEES